MEKYRSTADPSTGIHPYLPLPPPSISLATKLLRPFLFLLRLPLFLLAALLTLLLTPLLFIPCFLTRALTRLLARLLLFSLGATKFSPPSLPKSRLRVRGRPVQSCAPSAGELIVANLNGLIGPLQLVAAYSPTFVVPTEAGIARLSLRNLFASVAAGRPPSGLPIVDIESLVSRAAAPVVLFAEGGSSNGRGVLRFSPRALAAVLEVLTGLEGRRVFALGLATRRGQEYCGVKPSFTSYVVGLMSEVATDVSATYVDVPLKDISTVQAAVAKCAGLPAMAVGADGRQDFDAHWEQAGGMER